MWGGRGASRGQGWAAAFSQRGGCAPGDTQAAPPFVSPCSPPPTHHCRAALCVRRRKGALQHIHAHHHHHHHCTHHGRAALCVRRRKGTLQHVQVHPLVLRHDAVVGQPKVDQDLRGQEAARQGSGRSARGGGWGAGWKNAVGAAEATAGRDPAGEEPRSLAATPWRDNPKLIC